jgi:hypothetical protein
MADGDFLNNRKAQKTFDEANEESWIVVDIKNSWEKIYSLLNKNCTLF